MERERSKSNDESRSGPPQQDDSSRESANSSKPLNRLHETVGNSALQRLHEEGLIQANLEVSQPGDPQEREADRVAEQVMRMSAAEPASDSEEGVEVSRKATSGGSTIEGEAKEQIESVKGGGKPLSPSTRSYFEPRFGRDFSDIRVHTDAKADKAARSINAEAFTHGTDMVFRSNRYDPNSRSGKELIAHELTHVVQQNGGSSGLVSGAASKETVQRQEKGGEKVGSGERGQFDKTKVKGNRLAGRERKKFMRENKKDVNKNINRIAGWDADAMYKQMKTAAQSFENWYKDQSLGGGSYWKAGIAVLGAGVAIAGAVLPPASVVAGVAAASAGTISAISAIGSEVEKEAKKNASAKSLTVEQSMINKAETVRDIYDSYGQEMMNNKPDLWTAIGKGFVNDFDRQAERMLYQQGGVPKVPDNLETRMLTKMIESYQEYKEKQDLVTGPFMSSFKSKRAVTKESEELAESRQKARKQLGDTK